MFKKFLALVENTGSSPSWQFLPLDLILGSRDSRYSYWLRAGWPRSRSSSPSTGKIFLLSTASRSGLGPTLPPIQWVPGAISPGVKWPGREDDHSPPTSAVVKNTSIYTSTWRSIPPLVKHRDNFTWTLFCAQLNPANTLKTYFSKALSVLAPIHACASQVVPSIRVSPHPASC
jgi:hypothetical protein